MLSASLGVAGVVCSVNYGTAGSKQVLDQVRRMGTNVLIITPGQGGVIAGRPRTGEAATTLGERDYSAIRKELLTRTRSSAVLGCEPDYFVIKNWPVLAGGPFDSAQERGKARVAVIGHTVAVDLFGAYSLLGQRLMINRVPFTVIGVPS